ncbi:MAG: hypothetical protein HW421_3772 [Ignavibacteria bacterium]|nr:hypothetical protein [Ignavibacteria bacterium]
MSENDIDALRQMAESVLTNKVYDTFALMALVKGLYVEDNGIKDVCSRALSYPPVEFASEAARLTSECIREEDIEIRNLAADILINIGNPACEHLIQYLSDEDNDVRKFACDVLGLVGDESAVDAILALFDDSDENVIFAAYEAVGNIKSPKALEKLLAQYGKYDDLKPVIIEAAGKIGGTEAQGFLINTMKTEADMLLQTTCIDALSMSGSDLNICDYLLLELPWTPTELQPMLLKTIYAIAYRQNLKIEFPSPLRDVARNALMDDDEDIRMSGLLALGDEYFEDDVPCLIKITLQNNPDVIQQILFNLISNSDESILRFFVEKIYQENFTNETIGEFFQYLPDIMNSFSKEKKESVINILFDIMVKYPMPGNIELAEILSKISRDYILAKAKCLSIDSSQELDDLINAIK